MHVVMCHALHVGASCVELEHAGEGLAVHLPVRSPCRVPVIDYGTATLAQLMDAGYVRPGTGNVTVAYKGMTYRANLLPGGIIEFDGEQRGHNKRVHKCTRPVQGGGLQMRPVALKGGTTLT